MSDLQILAQHRDALLLAEVAALLHDMGKLSSQFIDQMSQQPSAISTGFEHENAIEKIAGFVDDKFLNALKSTKMRDRLHLDSIQRQEQIGQIMDLILHHDKARHSAFLVRLLNRCDGADSGADKGTTRNQGLPKDAKQPFQETLIASAFGRETPNVGIDIAKIDADRQKLSQKIGKSLGVFLDNPKQERSEILQLVHLTYRCGLGETRRSANDVTLWDHSFSVATLYKTSLATLLLSNSLNIDHLRWRLLRVNFDVLGIYAKAVKIGDLLGYRRAVDDACGVVKQLIEEEYPLGNEIYRDSTGIYFTFPDLPLPADLEQEIRQRVEAVEMELAPRIAVTVGNGNTAAEQLKGILGKARKEALETLAQPFDNQNLSTYWQQQWEIVGDGKWELCPVCRLRPMREKAEACEHCIKRRGSRIEMWEKNPTQTIWMDEISDHNDRVALIVGKFGLDDWLSGDLVQTMLVRAEPNNPGNCTPKNPSPARLRRVWETCQRFWTETGEEILARHAYGQGTQDADRRSMRLLIIPDKKNGWQEHIPYDGTINGRAISLLWREDAKHFVTISNLQLAGEIKQGQTIVVSEPDKPRQQITFVVQGMMQAMEGMGEYTPYLRLLDSPDQFLALVPAADALEIAEKIRAEYAEQFGKVQNRLPLFLGIVFFQRKTPLLAVMDTARRMLASEFANGEWRLTNTPQNDGKTVTLSLKQNGQCITLQVPLVMGDGTTEDVWYPYFELVGTPAAHHTYRFERDSVCWVHVKTLQANEKVRVTPSRFAYLFLESTAQRFRFDPTQDVLLLDELPRLMKMWRDLKQSGISDTGLRNVQALLESKGAAWTRDSEEKEFERLTRTTLKEAKLFERKDKEGNSLPDVITPEDVLSGRFSRCLELYLHILKLKLKEA
jgi:hypothetical protein